MSLDYRVTKPKDFGKINTSDIGELIWWSYIFDVPLEKLVTIIDKVGNSTEQIKKALS
jgi:hypothetical protein